MAGANKIKAGEAWWKITAQDETTKVLDQVADRLKQMGKTTMLAGAAISAAGAAIVGPILAAAKSFSDYVDSLNDATVQTGFTVESLSQLTFAAEQTGANFAALKVALKSMGKLTVQLASGSKQAAKNLEALGIATADFMAASPERRFAMLAEQLSKIQDESLRAGMAQRVFGKSASELLPLIAGGAKGLEEMQKRAHELGLSISSEDAKAFGQFGDELSAMGQQVRRAWWGLGAAMIEAITPVIPKMQQILRDVILFVDANRPLVKVVLAGAAALIVAGGALTAFGAAMSASGYLISTASLLYQTSFKAILGTFLTLGRWLAYLPALITGIPSVLSAIAAGFGMIATPAGLVVTTIAAIVTVTAAAIVAWVNLTESGAAAWAYFTGRVAAMYEAIKYFLGGIGAAIMSGEWQLAAQIAMAGVSLIFTQAWASIYSGVVKVIEWIGLGLLEMNRWVSMGMDAIVNGIIKAYNWLASQVGAKQLEMVSSSAAVVEEFQNQLRQWSKGKIDDQMAAVDASKRELKGLIDKAYAARKAQLEKGAPGGQDVSGLGQPDLSKLMGGGGAAGIKGPQAATMGTFSATVAGFIGSQIPDLLGEISDNTRAVVDKLGDVQQAVENNGMEWSE